MCNVFIHNIMEYKYSVFELHNKNYIHFWRKNLKKYYLSFLIWFVMMLNILLHALIREINVLGKLIKKYKIL